MATSTADATSTTTAAGTDAGSSNTNNGGESSSTMMNPKTKKNVGYGAIETISTPTTSSNDKPSPPEQPRVPVVAHQSSSVSFSSYSTDTENPFSVAPKPKQPHKKHSLFGIFFIMLGAFSFSVMFLLVKVMKDANTFTLVYYRSLVQITISLTTLLVNGKNPLGPNCLEARFFLVLRAVFGAAAVCMWFFGIQILPLPDAVTLQFTTPPFAAVFAVCLVGEAWLLLDMIGAVICLSGVALIAHPTWLFGNAAATATADIAADSDSDSSPTLDSDGDGHGDGDGSPTALLKALAVLVTTGGAACAGIAYVCVRKIGDRASAQVMVLYYGTLSIPMTIVGSYYFLGTPNVWKMADDATWLDWFWLLLMGLGGYGGQWFTNLGLQQETAATATLATSTQIVWTYIFELAFLHEPINAWSMAGTGLILGYMLLVAFLKLFPTPHQPPHSKQFEKGESMLLDLEDDESDEDEEDEEKEHDKTKETNNLLGAGSIGTNSGSGKLLHRSSSSL